MGLISNGTTIFDNGAMSSSFGTSLKLISKQTASSSTSINFTTGIDSSFNEYIFYFVNLHPATNDVTLNVEFSTDGGSSYGVNKTTTFFAARHRESDSATNLDYVTNRDLAQSTSSQKLCYDIGNLNDESACGWLKLFDPGGTGEVKQFLSTFVGNGQAEDCQNSFVGGYVNTTSAIDAVKFTMSSGNIDSGDIIMYGVG